MLEGCVGILLACVDRCFEDSTTMYSDVDVETVPSKDGVLQGQRCHLYANAIWVSRIACNSLPQLNQVYRTSLSPKTDARTCNAASSSSENCCSTTMLVKTWLRVALRSLARASS